MILIKNKENASLIRQYINQDVLFEDSNIILEGLHVFGTFNDELLKVPTAKRGMVFANLMSGYELHPAMKRILNEYDLEGDKDTDIVVSDRLTLAFQQLMLEVTRKVMSAKYSEENRLLVNRKLMAERIMQLYSLKISKKDPEVILIYCHGKGRWENGRIPIHRLIIELTHYLGGEIADSWTTNLEKSIMDILLRKVEMIDPAKFNGTYYPFANVTLNTEMATIVPHSRRYLMTMGSDIFYEPDAICPVFDKFLWQVFEDEKTIEFVQEWFGYTLCHAHKTNSLLIGVGSGANGKSTLFDILAQLVGISNVSSVPLSNFNTEFGLEPLIDMKLNLATESDSDGFKTGKLKALTAGEAISINRKNKPEITMTLPIKLVFLLNQLPMLSDSSFGFERRLIILPFNRTFTPDKQDKDLSKKLTAEFQGILNWAVVGLKRLNDKDFRFTTSKAMIKAKESYFGVGNPVEKFVQEKIIKQPNNRIASNDLLNSYRLWMAVKQYPYKGTDSPQSFWRLFDEATRKNLIQYDRRKSNGKNIIHDIAIKDEA